MAKKRRSKSVRPSTAGYSPGFTQKTSLKKSQDERDYLTIATVGEKAMGKSSFVVRFSTDYIEKNALNNNPRRVIILGKSTAFDVFNKITITDLENGWATDNPKTRRKWRSGIVVMNDPKGSDEMLYAVKKYVRNALIIVDDAAVFYKPQGNLPDWQKDMIITHRNEGCDLMLVFHKLRDINIAIRQHFWMFIFFKTPDKINGPQWFTKFGYSDEENLFRIWKDAQNQPYLKGERIQAHRIYVRDLAKMYAPKGKRK